MTHAWCSDPSRDAAVRAAEDGRDRPLPTLGECIEAVTECRSEQTKGDEMSQGMTTERVVLEITGAPGWKVHVTGSDVESVRVVEEEDGFSTLAGMIRKGLESRAETAEQQRDAVIRERAEESSTLREMWRLSREACYERAAERDAAIREREEAKARVAELEGCSWVPKAELDSLHARVAELEAASGGGEGEPVAWMCEWTDHVGLHHTKTDAEDEAAGDVVPQPLYRAPPQPRGWLTGEERNGLGEIATYLDTRSDCRLQGLGSMIRVIFARSSPPEVVWPERCPPGGIGETWERARDGMWIAALAAVGVPVKEVGQ